MRQPILIVLFALSLLAAGCPSDDDDTGGDDDTGDDDSGDDDTGDDDTSDDDSGDDDTGDDDTGDDDTGDDDTGDDDTYNCAGSWDPQSVLTGLGWVQDLAVHESPPRMAISTGAALTFYDLSAPATPVLDTQFTANDLGPWGNWRAVADASWGFAVTGETAAGPMNYFHLVAIDVSTGSITIGPQIEMSHMGVLVAVDGTKIVAAGYDEASFFDFDGVNFTLLGTRSYPYSLSWLNGLALAGDTAIVTSYDSGVMLLPQDPGQPVVQLGTVGNPQIPLQTAQGWVIPETGNFWVGCNGALELLDVAQGTLSYLASAPCISAFDAEDGPFQATRYAGEMLLANSESGVLRFDWTPPTISVPNSTTLTPAVWPDVPQYPLRVERIDDLLVILGGYGDTVGLVQICAP